MGNSKNKKVPKKRKTSNTSRCNTSSDQKENVPKTQKTRNNKLDPVDGIAMSKQLLLKKKTSKLRTQSRSSSKPGRMCPNGKPIPSLAELEKMFEDSDEDDQTPKTPSKKPPCASSTPVKATPTTVSQKNLFSPTTINKISERLLDSLKEQKLPDPSEVLEATSLLREKSPPPTPIVPPKKRKKTEIPYIVGCKDRPKVIRQLNTNFCKGDEDYGVEASSEDPEEPQLAKRGKKSQIPKYSKSIFNAQSDEIAERLAKDDAANLSDASSDSNKTIEYEPTLIQKLRPQSFSPLPSTSRDSETFKKNDKLFNESLKMTEDTVKKNDEVIDKNLKEINITKEKTTKEKDEQMTNASTVTTPIKREDCDSINKTSSPIKTGDDDVQVIDIPYDTIVIDDICERTVTKKNISSITDNSVIEIIEPAVLELAIPKNKTEIPDDEDCMIVPNSGKNNNYKNSNLNEPIVIDDEYSNINMEFNSYNDEPIEIIDIDDIIAENNSILDKWKNSREFNKKTTYRNVTAVHTVTPSTTVQNTSTPNTTSTQRTTVQASVLPSNTLPASLTPGATLEASVPPSNTLPASLTPGTTLQASIPPSNTLQASVPPINTLQASLTPVMTLQAGVPTRTTLQARLNPHTALETNIHPNTAVPSTSRQSSGTSLLPEFKRILDAFFNERLNNINLQNETSLLLKARSSGSTACAPLNKNVPVSTKTSRNGNRKESNSNNSSTTFTNVQPASPVTQRNIGDCPICLDPLSSSNGIASTICGHVFCLTCIQASVKTNGKKCPTCRKGLKGAGFHQLYL